MSENHNEQYIVAFSEDEMLQFGADAAAEISQADLKLRKGIEVGCLSIEVSIDDEDTIDLPLSVENKFTVGFSIYADKLNPTQLIVDGEFESEYFRIYRPSNLNDLQEILEEWEREKKDNEVESEWEREHQENLQNNLRD